MKLVPDLSVSTGLVESAAEVGVAGKQFISLMHSCEIVGVRNVEDALGDPCSKKGRQTCIDCGCGLCGTHARPCDVCRAVFCPVCLLFHLKQHPKPVSAEHRKCDRRIAEPAS